ncbi:MAG: carboxylate-amine ligase [Pseudorhodoplanes sp.]
MADAFTFGLKEEYFLVDAQTKAATRAMPEGFLQAAKAATAGRAASEFLQSQIEVMTRPHADVAAARSELRDLRRSLAKVAAEHGLAILAAGTHPSASWPYSRQSEGERYDSVMDDLQMIGHRNMLCGLHVHVEVPDAGRRIEIMSRLLPYLPLFIALATSSPFWRSRPTGLKGYRLAAYDELPRTGIPELFRTQADYDAYVAALVKAGVMPDASYIWWAIRPSLHHPTLELRAPDCCTLLDDSIAIASLYRALVRHLFHNPRINGGIDAVQRAIVIENKWRAQRYGVHGSFVGDGGAVPVIDLLARVIDQVTPDADALGCLAEIRRCRAIVDAGTSADAQLRVFAQHQERCESHEEALRAVTDWIAVATLQ